MRRVAGNRACSSSTVLVAVALSLFFAAAAVAEQLHFRSFSLDQGLPQSQVFALAQDHHGLLWLGTAGGGVGRFDGTAFTSLTIADGLPSDMVMALLVDRRGVVWIGTYEGAVTAWDQGRLTTWGAADGLPAGRVSGFAEDPAGNLWIATRKGGVVRFDGTSFTAFTVAEGLASDAATDVLVDRDGRVWVATGKGVSRFDGTAFAVVGDTSNLPDARVLCLAEDRAGRLWVGTYGGGAACFDGNSWQRLDLGAELAGARVFDLLEDRHGTLWLATEADGVVRWDGAVATAVTTAQGLISDQVYRLLEDREGSLWIGTDDGLAQLPSLRFTSLTRADGLASDEIWQIVEDQSGAIWFATENDGATRWDGSTFRTFTTADGLGSDMVVTAAVDHAGNVWFGFLRGGASRWDGTRFTTFGAEQGLPGTGVWAIHADRAGTVWFGTEGGGVAAFDGTSFCFLSTVEGLAHATVNAIAETAAGDLVFATDAGGVSVWDGRSLTSYTTADGLAHNCVTTVVRDDRGDLWLGTFGGGVSRLQVGSDGTPTFTTIGEADGLSHSSVLALVADGPRLWVGTNRGLDRLDLGRLWSSGEVAVTSFGREEGFVGLECNQGSGFKDSRGRIWFGTIRGAVRYNPEHDRTAVAPPAVALTGFELFYEPVDWSAVATEAGPAGGLPGHLTLDYQRNHLGFDFQAVSLMTPSRLRYSYRLDGFDRDWSPAAPERHATYANLPPGRYTFRVRASTGGGWSEPAASASITITPPWWRTPWFLLTAGGLALALPVAAHRLKVRAMRARQAELEALVAQRTSELRASNELKNEFLGIAAHDLRGPLGLISGWTGVTLAKLESGSLDRERARRDLGRVLSIADRLQSLVGELLDIAAIESGRLRLALAPAPPGGIGEEGGILYTPAAAAKGISLAVEAPRDLPAVAMDRARVFEVVDNLLSNAIKYTHPGGRVTVTMEACADEVVTHVADTGQGLSADDLGAVFSSYRRLSARPTGNEPSTGLGLAIAKKIIDAHRGRIWVESDPGRGARFSFTLPVAVAECGRGSAAGDGAHGQAAHSSTASA